MADWRGLFALKGRLINEHGDHLSAEDVIIN